VWKREKRIRACSDGRDQNSDEHRQTDNEWNDDKPRRHVLNVFYLLSLRSNGMDNRRKVPCAQSKPIEIHSPVKSMAYPRLPIRTIKNLPLLPEQLDALKQDSMTFLPIGHRLLYMRRICMWFSNDPETRRFPRVIRPLTFDEEAWLHHLKNTWSTLWGHYSNFTPAYLKTFHLRDLLDGIEMLDGSHRDLVGSRYKLHPLQVESTFARLAHTAAARGTLGVRGFLGPHSLRELI